MIQILAAMPQGGDPQNPLAISSKDGGAASFVSLFAQALMQGASAEAAPGKPVVAALPGHGKRLTELGLDDMANEISLAAPKAGTGAADVAAAAMATTAVAAEGMVDVPGELAAAATEATEDAAPLDVTDQALMAMLTMPANAQATVEAAVTSTADPAEGGDEAADATTMADQNGRSGKKLPNPVAVLAVQKQALASIQKHDGQSTAELMGRPFSAAADPGPAGEVAEATSTAGLGASLSAVKDMPAQVTTAPVSNTPVSGQEAALAATRTHAASGAQGKAVLGMQTQMGSAAWQQELGDKLVWVSGQRGQMAELVLTPPSLGAVEVRLNVNGGEASAQFFAANPQVREALEAALPRLRELMGSAGINLGEAMVSDQSFGQRDKAESGRSSGQADLAGIDAVDEGGASESVRLTGKGLLDYFA